MFSIGTGVLLLLIAAGLIRSFAAHHSLPPVGVEYTSELERLVREKGDAAALPWVRMAASIDFDNETAAKRLLQSARAAADPDNTVRALVALVRFKPEDAQFRNELVSALLSQGRVVEALAQGRVALRLSPESSATHCNLGAALLGLGQKREAAAAYRRALELDRNSEAARMALEFPLRGF